MEGGDLANFDRLTDAFTTDRIMAHLETTNFTGVSVSLENYNRVHHVMMC